MSSSSASSTPPVRPSHSPPQPPYYGHNYDLSSREYHGGYPYPPPPQSGYINHVPYPQYVTRPQMFVIPYGGYAVYPSLANTATTASASAHPGAPIHVEHTDDASMKSSDILRRRCFNCCTTETATWRRSKLSAGKLLCNKCGIFERTHSRPRPEQLSYKHTRISKAPPFSSAPQSTYDCNQSYPPYPTYTVPSGREYHPQSATHPPFLLPRPPPPQKQEFSSQPGTGNTACTRPFPVTSNTLPLHDNSDKPSHNFDSGNQDGNSAYREEESTHTGRSNSCRQSRHDYGDSQGGGDQEGAQSAHPVNSH